MKTYTFLGADRNAEPIRVDKDPHILPYEGGDGPQGHVYFIEAPSGASLAELMQLVEAIRKAECPRMNVQDQARLQDGGTLTEGWDDE